jgi:hypothetical protein
MRRFAVLVLTVVIGVGVVSFATADESIQTEIAKIKPTKISKSKYQDVKYVNMITTFDVPGTNEPPKSFRTVLDFPKQLKFNNNKWPFCKTDAVGLVRAALPADAKKACGRKSIVSADSGSKAVVRVGTDTGAIVINNQVVAFNEPGGELLLFIKPTGAFAGLPASILVGELKKSKSGSKYRQALDVRSSPLAAGALSLFQITNPRSGYVQAKCKPKKLYWKATTFFEDGSKTSDTHSTTCKPKN